MLEVAAGAMEPRQQEPECVGDEDDESPGDMSEVQPKEAEGRVVRAAYFLLGTHGSEIDAQGPGVRREDRRLSILPGYYTAFESQCHWEMSYKA